MLQPVLVHFHAARPVQQHIGHALRVLFHQTMQQLRDLEAAHLRQGADHAEIDHTDAAIAQVDDVARVRIGVEAAVLQHHLQYDVGTAPGQFTAVEAGRIDTGQITPRNAVDEVLHVQAFAGPLPVHRRNQDVVPPFEVARDALGIAALRGEIQLAPQRHGELLHHLGGSVTAQVRQPGFDDLGQPCQQPQIGFNHVTDTRATHLQHHFAAIAQPRTVGLGQRSSGHRGFIKEGEHLRRRRTEIGLQLFADLLVGQCRDRVLQLGEFGDPVRRQQVDAGGEHLAQLHEGRPEILQGAAHAHRRGHPQHLLPLLVPVQQAAGTFQYRGQADAPHDVAEAVADQDGGDFLQPAKVTDGAQRLPHRCLLRLIAGAACHSWASIPCNAAATVCRRMASRSPSNWNSSARA